MKLFKTSKQFQIVEHKKLHHELISNFNIHFTDVFSVSIPAAISITPEEIAKGLLTDLPFWIQKLLDLRNLLVQPLDLKTGIDHNDNTDYPRIGIVKIQGKSPDAILVGDDDSHLNFRILCQSTEQTKGKNRAVVATYVHFNNWIGRVYFFFIKPFHRLIVKNMLGRIAKNLYRQP